MSSAACSWSWCDGLSHGSSEHRGVIAHVETSDDPVELHAYFAEATEPAGATPDPIGANHAAIRMFHFELGHWEITSDELEQEIATLYRVVDTFAAAMRETIKEPAHGIR